MSFASKIERFWYKKSNIKWLLWPLSQILFLLTAIKFWLYRSRVLNSNLSKVPVVVVGNITVGGTGKTPFIGFLVGRLISQGFKLGIVSRGYLSQAPHYPYLISQQDTVETIGDEAFMQFQKFKLPMAIGSDRSAAVELLASQHSLDLIISDDGLQHYKMGRNLEFLLTDASRGFGNGLCLPFGPLRESQSRLKSVDLIVQNGVQKDIQNDTQKGHQPLIKALAKYQAKTAFMAMQPLTLVQVNSGKNYPLDLLTNKSVNAVCGIGNPDRFFSSLNPLCAEMTKHIFADHHAFSLEDFVKLNDLPLVMTEKDAVKCQGFAKDNWYYLKVGANINADGIGLIDRLLGGIIKR